MLLSQGEGEGEGERECVCVSVYLSFALSLAPPRMRARISLINNISLNFLFFSLQNITRITPAFDRNETTKCRYAARSSDRWLHSSSATKCYLTMFTGGHFSSFRCAFTLHAQLRYVSPVRIAYR